ncbi:MAG: tetratricopeptide repeat protein [Phycisphaerales bacterium]|nr:MAG: tetratricopeptide repeat protein [Phycisphaerales bacterium]
MKRTLCWRIMGASLLTAATLSGCQTQQEAEPAQAAIITLPRQAGPTELQAQRLEGARRALDDGDYDLALTMFRDILAENPTITTAYVGIGDIHLVRKDYDKAEPAFARACRIEPRNFDAQYGHGVSLQMLERFLEAIKAYLRALSIKPESMMANLHIATTYLQIDEAHNAVEYAEKAVEADPASGPARANLGAVYEKVGRNAEAIEQYLIASELMEASPQLTMNLVNTLAKEKRYRETVNAAENLIKVEPSVNAYERLGWAHFRLGEYAESLEAYRAAVAMDPAHWPSLNGVGVNALNKWLLSKKTDHQAALEARDAFRRSLRANPEQPKVVRMLLKYNL